MPIKYCASHSLLPDLIRRGGTVVDCGANVGDFSRIMVETFSCKVLAFEASPVIFGRIPKLRGLQAYNVAICGSDGPITLHLDADITRSSIVGEMVGNLKAVAVEGRILEGFLNEVGIIDEIEVLKLDIEGAELEVLDSLSDDFIRRIGQVTIEFHDFLGYHTTAQVLQRIDRIVALGFRELAWSKQRNTSDVLLINKSRIDLLRYYSEQYGVRPVKAFHRLLRKIKL